MESMSDCIACFLSSKTARNLRALVPFCDGLEPSALKELLHHPTFLTEAIRFCFSKGTAIDVLFTIIDSIFQSNDGFQSLDDSSAAASSSSMSDEDASSSSSSSEDKTRVHKVLDGIVTSITPLNASKSIPLLIDLCSTWNIAFDHVAKRSIWTKFSPLLRKGDAGTAIQTLAFKTLWFFGTSPKLQSTYQTSQVRSTVASILLGSSSSSIPDPLIIDSHLKLAVCMANAILDPQSPFSTARICSSNGTIQRFLPREMALVLRPRAIEIESLISVDARFWKPLALLSQITPEVVGSALPFPQAHLTDFMEYGGFEGIFSLLAKHSFSPAPEPWRPTISSLLTSLCETCTQSNAFKDEIQQRLRDQDESTLSRLSDDSIHPSKIASAACDLITILFPDGHSLQHSRHAAAMQMSGGNRSAMSDGSFLSRVQGMSASPYLGMASPLPGGDSRLGSMRTLAFSGVSSSVKFDASSQSRNPQSLSAVFSHPPSSSMASLALSMNSPMPQSLPAKPPSDIAERLSQLCLLLANYSDSLRSVSECRRTLVRSACAPSPSPSAPLLSDLVHDLMKPMADNRASSLSLLKQSSVLASEILSSLPPGSSSSSSSSAQPLLTSLLKTKDQFSSLFSSLDIDATATSLSNSLRSLSLDILFQDIESPCSPAVTDFLRIISSVPVATDPLSINESDLNQIIEVGVQRQERAMAFIRSNSELTKLKSDFELEAVKRAEKSVEAARQRLQERTESVLKLKSDFVSLSSQIESVLRSNSAYFSLYFNQNRIPSLLSDDPASALPLWAKLSVDTLLMMSHQEAAAKYPANRCNTVHPPHFLYGAFGSRLQYTFSLSKLQEEEVGFYGFTPGPHTFIKSFESSNTKAMQFFLKELHVASSAAASQYILKPKAVFQRSSLFFSPSTPGVSIAEAADASAAAQHSPLPPPRVRITYCIVFELPRTCCSFSEWTEAMEGRLTAVSLAESFRQSLAALRDLHSRGIVHGNITSQHLVVDSSSSSSSSSVSVKLCNVDASVAAVALASSNNGMPIFSPPIKVTRRRVSMPTAPSEVIDTGVATPASDVYCLGRIMLEAFTGSSAASMDELDEQEDSIMSAAGGSSSRRPFEQRILDALIPSVTSGMASDLETALRSLLHKDSSRRPTSAQDAVIESLAFFWRSYASHLFSERAVVPTTKKVELLRLFLNAIRGGSSSIVPEKNFTVDRQNLVEQVLNVISWWKYTNDKDYCWNLKIGFLFDGETGHGEGVNRDLFSSFWMEVCSRNSPILEPSNASSDDQGISFLPRIIASSASFSSSSSSAHQPSAVELEPYRLFGRIIKYCLIHDYPISPRLSPFLLGYLAGLSPTWQDLCGFDPVLARGLERATEDESLLGELSFQDVRTGKETVVTASNVEQFKAAKAREVLLDRRKAEMEAIKSGFDFFLGPEIKCHLETFSAAELSMLMCGGKGGSERMEAADVLDELVFSADLRPDVVAWFKAAVKKMSEVQLRRLLRLTTSLCSIPYNGFKTKIQICPSHSTPPRLYARTCFQQLEVPQQAYRSEEELTRDLFRSLEWVDMSGVVE